MEGSMNKSKRDEKAKLVADHFSKIGASTDDVFKYGYDAGFDEAQAHAKVLVDEMTIAAGFVEVYDTSGTMSKMINRALEQYRKAME